ncbi:hypothetical protein D3C86_1689330 [compost metagenome]
MVITRTALCCPPVERQEEGIHTRQLGGHGHLELVQGKMHQGSPPEGQQRLTFARRHQRAIDTVLFLGIFEGLLEAGFELQRRHRDAVQEQRQIEPPIIAVRAIDQLGHHPQPVLGIPLDQLGVEVMVRLEGSHR